MCILQLMQSLFNRSLDILPPREDGVTSGQIEGVAGAEGGERVGGLVGWTAGCVDWTPQSRALRGETGR